MTRIWALAMLGLLPPLAVAVALSWRGSVAHRLVAVQLAGALTVAMLMVMTFAFDQSAFGDIPLTLALLTWPGMALFALFIERWL